MLNKFLKEVISIIVGKQAEDIISPLDSAKYTNEFLIAKKLGITINQTRNILYKIADYGLISSIRKKDKKKGWYTYFWKIETLKSLEFLREILLKRIEQINNKIKSRETKEFYVCEECNIEFNEESALLHDFMCPECGKVLTLKNNTKFLRELNRELVKSKKELKLLDIEIKKEKEKAEKRRIKEIKKMEKDKKKGKNIKKAVTKKRKVTKTMKKKPPKKPVRKKKMKVVKKKKKLAKKIKKTKSKKFKRKR